MDWTLKFSLLTSAFLISMAPAYAVPSSPLYIDDARGNVGTVNLGTGSVTILGNAGVVLTDIGFTSNGNLYGTSFTDFYSVNNTTGVATLIGSYGGTGRGGLNALVGSGTGLLAASTATNSLYSINVSPFSISTLNGTLSAGGSAGDLAFAFSGGSLYETLSTGDLVKATISGNTVTSSVVGNMGNNGVFGLATGDDGVTYAVAGTQIYTLNLSTAVLTPFLNYAGSGLGSANGTAFLGEAALGGTTSSVPEPASTALMGAGVMALGIIRRRRKG